MVLELDRPLTRDLLGERRKVLLEILAEGLRVPKGRDVW